MFALFAQVVPTGIPEDIGPLLAAHKWGLATAVAVLILTKVLSSVSSGFFGTRYGKLASAGIVAAAVAVVHAIATGEPVLAVVTEAVTGAIGAIGAFSAVKNVAQGEHRGQPVNLAAHTYPEITLEPDGNLILSEELECGQKLSHGYEAAPLCRVTFLPTAKDTAFMDFVELSFRDAAVPSELRVGQRYRMELRLVPVDAEEFEP